MRDLMPRRPQGVGIDDDLSKKEFTDFLKDFREMLASEIEASATGFDTSENARKARLAKIDDFLWFARTYFPHYIRDRKEKGKVIPVRPSVLHLWIGDHFAKVIQDDDSHNIALAAPRGEAKSTMLLIFLIWCIVRNLKHYILYIMDVYEQAAVVVEALMVELEVNPRLISDFPKATGQGDTWRQGEIVTRNRVKIHARGAGQRVRGLKHGAWRPDLCLLDDIENDENVESPDQRDKLTAWINSAVENLGEAGEKFDILYVGTMLHHDSTLARTQKNPMWKAVTFQAIITWPDRMDLWDEWEAILRNDGLDVADAFYRERAELMEAGAVLSWPDKRPLYTLMKLRAKVTHDPFEKEYQNSPTMADAAFTTFTYWHQWVDRWVMFGAVDPSLGKHGKKRDPSALLVGGFDRETGILDVVHAGIRKRLPDVIINDVIELQREFRCIAWFVESVQFQEFLRTELAKRAIKAGLALPAHPVMPHADKDLRIARLQPPIADGLVRFKNNQKTLLDQLRHWPKADHDDGPDCLEMLWTHAVQYASPTEIRGGIRTGTPMGLADYVR